jgi:hypothetical protein
MGACVRRDGSIERAWSLPGALAATLTHFPGDGHHPVHAHDRAEDAERREEAVTSTYGDEGSAMALILTMMAFAGAAQLVQLTLEAAGPHGDPGKRAGVQKRWPQGETAFFVSATAYQILTRCEGGR